MVTNYSAAAYLLWCLCRATPGAEPSKPNAPKARADALAAVERVHELDYVRYLEAVCRDGGGQLDSDTYIAPLSYEVALLAQSAWWVPSSLFFRFD